MAILYLTQTVYRQKLRLPNKPHYLSKVDQPFETDII
jgi:hypothetical protein